jgi:hypothetical protein
MLTMEPVPLRAKVPRAEGLAGEKHRLQVHVQNIVPVALAEIDRVVAADDAGIVDQDIDLIVAKTRPAPPSDRKNREAVRGHRHLRSRSRRRTGVRRRHVRAGAAHGQGDGLADAGIGAGHQRRLARQ